MALTRIPQAPIDLEKLAQDIPCPVHLDDPQERELYRLAYHIVQHDDDLTKLLIESAVRRLDGPTHRGAG